MQRVRGYTLIELMIAIAIIAISVTVIGDGLLHQREAGADLLSEERAVQLLEYQAEAVVLGRAIEPAIEQALLAALPEPRAERQAESGGRVSLTVSWRTSNGRRQSRSLTVFGRAP